MSNHAKSRGNFIGGEWRRPKQGDGELTSHNPAKPSEVLWTMEIAASAADDAVEAARVAFASWRKKPIEDRAELLLRLKEQLLKHGHELAEGIARETGKPLWEAHTEITALRGKIDLTLGDGRADITLHKLADGSGFVGHHPHGVMAVLGPFNFPLSLSHGHIVPALLAGNTVVLKPSDQAPRIAQCYVELFEAAGFPSGVMNLVQGGAEAGRRLATHPEVRGVLFTGSYAVGRALTLATLDQPNKLLVLEMGGKNAAIVLPDAPYQLALYEALFSAFVTTGQRCTATSRLIVVDQGDIYDRLERDVVRIARELRVGDPFDATTFMGPLVSAAAKQRYLEACADLANAGQVLLAARGSEGAGYFVTPQVVRVDAETWRGPAEAPGARYLREEIFGPSIAIHRARDVAHALAIANDTPYGLALSVFTADRDAFDVCLAESRAGIVNWNKGTVGATGKLPFGGIGKSGNFRPAGSYSGRYCTYPVATVIGEALPKPELFPPGFPVAGILEP